ncbi:MAG: hypothetical protein GEV04_14960 [Actinophytocola sp.]|nr:hypothetical protein [Actinophytocola sp.]
MRRTAMKTATATPVRLGDVVITVLLLAVFVGAYLLAQDWPFRTKLFPGLLATAGIGIAVLKLGGHGVQAYRHRTRHSATRQEDAGSEQGDDHSIEYVFGTAGARAWLAALGWAAAFFVALCVLGVFITVPLFTLAYLKISGSAGWLGATIYAVVAGGVLWFVFGELLAVPMPAGIF